MRWFYLRDKNRNPVACVASERYTRNEGTDHERISVAFGVSTYNPADNYTKEMAREVAIGRLNKGVTHGFAWGEKLDTGSILTLVPKVKQQIVQIIAIGNYPERTKKAAQLWLDTRVERTK